MGESSRRQPAATVVPLRSVTLARQRRNDPITAPFYREGGYRASPRYPQAIARARGQRNRRAIPMGARAPNKASGCLPQLLPGCQEGGWLATLPPNPAPYEAVQSASRLSVEQCHARGCTPASDRAGRRTSPQLSSREPGDCGETPICFAVGQFRSLRPRAKRTARRSGCWWPDEIDLTTTHHT